MQTSKKNSNQVVIQKRRVAAFISEPLVNKKAKINFSARVQGKLPEVGDSSILVYKALEEEMADLTPNPGLWLATPHQMLGGRSPLQIAFTGDEGKQIVIDLIRMIKSGMFS